MKAQIFPPIVRPRCPGSGSAVPTDRVDLATSQAICPQCEQQIEVRLSGSWYLEDHGLARTA